MACKRFVGSIPIASTREMRFGLVRNHDSSTYPPAAKSTRTNLRLDVEGWPVPAQTAPMSEMAPTSAGDQTAAGPETPPARAHMRRRLGAARPTRSGRSTHRIPDTTVVIGAGPYGLAVASYLSHRELPFRCFGHAMAGWSEHMPRGMHLKSRAPASSIGAPRFGRTLGDYCDHIGLDRFDKDGGEVPIPISDFISYGLWFQALEVPGLEETRVTRVEKVGGGFEVALETGERIEAGSVVVAAGVAPFAHVPVELGGGSAPADLISHTRDHCDLSVFRGAHVAVVGAGQSALETAVLLSAQGAEVDVIARCGDLVWGGPPLPPVSGALQVLRSVRRPYSPLGDGWVHCLVARYAGAYRLLPDDVRLAVVARLLGPFGSWWLRDAFTDRIRLHLATRVVEATPAVGRVELELADQDGGRETLIVDHVIAGTGYRVDVTKLDFLTPSLQARVATIAGWPRLSPSSESSVPGLFFTGLPAAGTFGPVLRFVAGSEFGARRVTSGVTQRLLA